MDLKEVALNALTKELEANPDEFWSILKRILALVEGSPELEKLLIDWLRSLLIK